MRLGELVAIMARNPARPGRDQWQHRQLDERETRRELADQPQRIGMHDILGIVQHDSERLTPLRLFPMLERGPELIEAIGLGRRSRPRG